MKRVKVNEYGRDQPPHLAVHDFGQDRAKSAARDEFRDEQADDPLGLIPEPGQKEHHYADSNEP